MGKRHVSFVLLLLVSSLFTGACTNLAVKNQNHVIESGSTTNSYKGIEKPVVERRVKITDEQQKKFDTMIQNKSSQNPDGQESGGNAHGSGNKPNV